MSSRKGQIWSLDFTTALLVLSFLLLLTTLLWNSLAIRWQSSNSDWQMETDALFASEALVTSPGVPYSWERLPAIDENISVIGLASSRNELGAMKVARLLESNATSYDLIRRKLGLSRYNLSINISTVEKNPTSYEFGRFAGGMDKAVVYERLALLNGTPVRVRVEVWR